jgi:monofunctional biosynthetic peptidoglycan transglycosylase
MKNKKRTFLSKIFLFIKRAILAFFILSILTVLIYRFLPIVITPLMVIRMGEQIFDGESPKLNKVWVPIEEMSPNIVQAAITAEDQNFHNHMGFDIKAMKQAFKNNKKGKKIKGGSTISQQTAKNVFLWPSRSYVRKAFEGYFTFLMELTWSKKRIMEVYLNVIEMGDGIYGVEMAAQKYFHKSAKKLSKSESALIVACFPNPRRWNASKPTGYIKRRQQWIIGNMGKMRRVDWTKK